MLGGGRRISRGVIGCSVVFVLTGLSIAGASGSLTTESETAVVSSSGDVVKTAPSCHGKKPVSGGFVVKSDGPSDVYGFPVQLERAGQNAFHSRVGVVGGSNTKVVGYSYCQAESSQVESKLASLPGDLSVKSATAKCDDGRDAVGGGFSLDTDEALASFTLSSRPKGTDGWKTRAIGSTPDGHFESQVLCRAGASTKTVSKTKTIGNNDDFAKFSISAKCPKGKRVLSGGFDLTDEFSKGGPFLNGSHRVGQRTWKLDVVTEVRRPVTAYAVCE